MAFEDAVADAQVAVRADSPWNVEFIIKKRLPATSRQRAWDYVLHFAAEGGTISCLKLALKRGANPNAVCGLFYALHVAAENGRLDCLNMLIRNGASVDVKCPHLFRTALHCASQNGHVECARALLLERADVNAVDVWGHTALHDAAKHGQLVCFELLLSFGADAERLDDKNSSALGLAPKSEQRRFETVLLREKRASEATSAADSVSFSNSASSQTRESRDSQESTPLKQLPLEGDANAPDDAMETSSGSESGSDSTYVKLPMHTEPSSRVSTDHDEQGVYTF